MSASQPPTRPTASDDAWLDALAGRPAPSLSPEERTEVEHLRTAWKARKERLESQLPEVDDEFVQRLLERLPKETTDQVHAQGDRPEVRSAERVMEAVKVPLHKRIAANGPRFTWGMAASFLIAAVIAVQMGVFNSDEDDRAHQILRGGNATPLIVDDPSARAAELMQALQATGAAPTLQTLKKGRFVLQVQATPAVLEVLGQQRIVPQTKDGKIVLVLEKPATSNSP